MKKKVDELAKIHIGSSKAEEKIQSSSSKIEEKKEDVKVDGKPTIVTVGDSIVKDVKGWLMSRDKRVKVDSFSGANMEDVEDFITPIMRRKSDEIILYVGTNNLQNRSPGMIADNILTLAQKIENHGIRSAISLITFRNDDLWEKAKVVNNILLSESSNVIEHTNITGSHLNRSNLHLNRRGTAALASNFIFLIYVLIIYSLFQYSVTEQPNTNKTHIVSKCERFSGPSGLKICCLNINSLTHHFDELNMFLDDEQPHIMA